MKQTLERPSRWAFPFSMVPAGPVAKKPAYLPPKIYANPVGPEKQLPSPRCPTCHRAPDRSAQSIPALFGGGLKQLLAALLMIVLSMFRIARFAVGGVLCLIGTIGLGLHLLGKQIAHRDDRQYLPGTRRPRAGTSV